MLGDRLRERPLVAILRGLEPDDAVDVGTALVEEGFGILEVPLNSPCPFDSIRQLEISLGTRALVGAGTVLRVEDCEAIAAAGGRLMVAPNFDPRVVRAAKEAGLLAVPGVGTVSEAFAAIEAGADALKLFPAETLGPVGLRAWRAVLPPDVLLLPVGGVTPASMAAWHRAGADGYGIGSALFRPAMGADALRANARAFVEAARALFEG